MRLTTATDVPFPFVFKLPAIAADVLGAYLLWRIWLRRTAGPCRDGGRGVCVEFGRDPRQRISLQHRPRRRRALPPGSLLH